MPGPHWRVPWAASLPAILQVDTGMSRLGLSPRELATVVDDPGRLDGVELRYVMSHLACSEQQSHALNADQLARFKAARAMLPAAPASFANSSGIFLSPDYHFDLARPGAALYGIAPVAGQPNPLRPVIRLQGKVIQLRDIDAGARRRLWRHMAGTDSPAHRHRVGRLCRWLPAGPQ